MKKGIHIMIPNKHTNNVYVTVLHVIRYSIWVQVESPKYKMICLNSPKLSDLLPFLTNSGQQSLPMFICLPMSTHVMLVNTITG